MRRQILKSILTQSLLLSMFMLFGIEVDAQRCEWLEVGGGAGHEQSFTISTDNNNDVIIGGTFRDSFSIASHFFPKSTTGSSTSFIIKYDEFGVIKWTKAIQHSGGNYCYVTSVTTDINNNIYVTGVFGGTLDFGNSITTSSTSVGTFLAKLNANGIAQWVVRSGAQPGGALTHRVVTDNTDNVYFAFTFSGSASFQGTNKTISSGTAYTNLGIAKYTSSGSFLNAASFGSFGSINDFLRGMGIDNSNNIYLLGYSNGSFNFGAKQLVGKGEIILKIDSALTPLNSKKTSLNFDNYSSHGIAVQGNGKFVVANNFYDSVNFGNNIWLKSPWKYDKFSINNHTLSIVYYDSSLNPIWARKNDTVKSNIRPQLQPNGGVKIKDDNIYFGGSIWSESSRLGGHELNYVGGLQKFFVSKMDTLGNFLWAFANNDSNGASSMRQCVADNNGDAYVTGYYRNKISVFNRSSLGFGTAADFFTAKIADYAITRGFVKSGPYCAGDTLKVPYTKRGIYNIGNEFIAELSDSAGNFDGGHRELGRLKDTADGVINGSLPLFNVATTSKYRIRIISTSPVIQSFYKLDTLRLLIYSKDSANAGVDQYICKGQSIRLGTTGGSRWEWSPTNTMVNPADSNNRQPLVNLINTQEYRIIISDSSGCGDIDTDYVKILVRPYIESKIVGDGVVCKGYRQDLKAVGAGGDSTQYWYQWRVVGLNILQGTDATLFIRPSNTTEYQVIMGDSCSDKLDTAYFKVVVKTNLKANPSPDTTVCKGKIATLRVIGTGCNPDKYTYEWTEKGSANVIGTDDTLFASPNTSTQYQVILKDTSTLLVDTATISVTIDSIFSISTIKDSTLCQGQNINLTANVFSCDTSNMLYTWDNGLGTGKTKNITPTVTTTYTVIGENTFNGLKDTAQVIITVRPKLTITLNIDSTICIGEQAELRAIATGGRNTTHQIQWTANNQPLSTNNNIVVTPTQTTTYKALLRDGCTVENDSAEITITVRPKLEIAVNPDSTICIGEQAELRATTTGGNTPTRGIQWFTNNQLLSTSNNITVTPNTTTIYKAIVSDACTTPNDSVEITITVRAPLNIAVNQDSTICIGEEAELRAMPSGGLTTSHQLQWTENNQPLSTNSTLKVTPNTSTTYKALLSDGCTVLNDSAEITITVRQALQLTTVAKDSICSNEILLLTATPTGGLISNHNIQWNTNNSLWTSNQNPATDTPQINTKYIATLSDNCSPTVYDTLNIVVLKIPKADFSAMPLSGCPPLTVTLTDNSTDNDSTQNAWTIGLGEYQGAKTQSHELLKTGTYNIKLNVKNALGCGDEKTLTNAITVFAKPKANFTIKPDIKEVEEPLQLYNLSRNETSIIWDMGDGNSITPQGNGDTAYTYDENDTGFINAKIIAINNQGCRDTSIKQIYLFDKVQCVIPSAFTPNNGDNLNNTFSPVCVGAANYTLTIYNRWGQVIYQRENGAWNGMYADQPAPAGIYLYKIQIQANSKKKKLTYGTVQLIR